MEVALHVFARLASRLVSGRARFPLAALLALGAASLAGCGGGRLGAGANVDRSTPENAYAFFKAAAQARAYEDEWALFSPNFKRAMNEVVGRNVSFADYQLARNTIATNSQADMRLLLASSIQDVQMQGADEAVLTISAGGQTIRPRMVRMLVWELRVKGDPEPFTDVLRGGGSVTYGADGGLSVRIPANPQMAGLLKSIPPGSIDSLRLERAWFVDDFGGLEGALGSGEPAPAAPGAPAPAPGAPEAPSALPAPPPGGYGNPG